MDTYQAILATVSCLATVATGISAVVAVFHYRKHWRDDDPHLVFVVDKKRPGDGTYRYWYVIRIVNTGRHPVRFGRFFVRNGHPTAVNLGTYSYPADGKRLVAPGDMITVDAIVVTEHDDVTFPESAEIWCETAAKQEIYVQRVEFSDDCPAGEAKMLATIAKLDVQFPPERIGWAPGYK